MTCVAASRRQRAARTGLHQAWPAGTALRMQRVRAIVFDLDDVLYDATVWRRWLLRVVSRLGVTASYQAFFRGWDRDYLPAVHRGERDHAEAFETFLLSWSLSRAQIDEVEAASQARLRQLAADLRPLPGVRSTLARLVGEGFPLGILCNSDLPAIEVRGMLGRLGIAAYFSIVTTSFDLERAQPDPACYLAAVAAFELTPEQVAFVGHDAVELAAARSVGMPTVAFNFDDSAQADVFLHAFAELGRVFPDPSESEACGSPAL